MSLPPEDSATPEHPGSGGDPGRADGVEPVAGVEGRPPIPDGSAPKPSGETLDGSAPRQMLRDRSSAAYLKVQEAAPPGIGERMRRFRERIRSRRTLDTAWRMLVLTLGLTLLVAGLIMFLIPGPGFATVILALVVLGSEFTWATRALDPVKSAARRASAKALDPRRRRRNLLIGATAGVLIAIVLLWYLVEFGFTMGPVLTWVTGLFA